ncbi:DUF4328 domain-containing protein [Kitasatospora sp. NPDC050543]|uniref:DUF4328 domain-containing protein n=1 Tax=Kitasatospora sp. NPDC050543 TaxID=3364054 RepID=UPI00378F5CA7
MPCTTCHLWPAITSNHLCSGCASAAPGWPLSYRSPRALAIAVTVLLSLCAAVRLALLVMNIRLYGMTGDVLADIRSADGELIGRLTDIDAALDGGHLLVEIVTAIVFIIWFHRVRANAGLFVPTGHTFGKGWAIGGWFTPFVALWIPWRMAADNWQASAPLGGDGERRFVPHTVVSLWWVSFVGAVMATRLGGILIHPDVDAIRSAVRVLIAGDVLEVVAAGLAITMVWRLTGMQDKRAAVYNPWSTSPVTAPAAPGH